MNGTSFVDLKRPSIYVIFQQLSPPLLSILSPLINGGYMTLEQYVTDDNGGLRRHGGGS